MAIERKVLQNAAARLALLPFFPAGDVSMALVMAELEKIVHSPESLQWLIDTTVTRATKWEGVAQLRALYSTRWKPKDGIEGGHCTIQGHTASDSESQYLEQHEQRKALPDVDIRKLLERR